MYIKFIFYYIFHLYIGTVTLKNQFEKNRAEYSFQQPSFIAHTVSAEFCDMYT